MQIPFNRPYLTGNELKYMKIVMDSLDMGGHISGDGIYTKKVQNVSRTDFAQKKH